MLRSRVIVVAVFALVVVGLLTAYRLSTRNRTEIRSRYGDLQIALSSTDTNAVLALIAPEYRSNFDSGELLRLQGFARPLGARSKNLILRERGDGVAQPKLVPLRRLADRRHGRDDQSDWPVVLYRKGAS